MTVAVLAQDVTRSILEYNENPWTNPHYLNGCHFHDHSDGNKCSETP